MELEDIKVGNKISLFYSEDNINNKIIHIRAIIDDDYICFRTWSKKHRGWNYHIEHRIFFVVNKHYIKIQK